MDLEIEMAIFAEAGTGGVFSVGWDPKVGEARLAKFRSDLAEVRKLAATKSSAFAGERDSLAFYIGQEIADQARLLGAEVRGTIPALGSKAAIILTWAAGAVAGVFATGVAPLGGVILFVGGSTASVLAARRRRAETKVGNKSLRGDAAGSEVARAIHGYARELMDLLREVKDVRRAGAPADEDD